MTLETWVNITVESLLNLWASFLNFLPGFFGAVIFFVIGWLVAFWVGRLFVRFLELIRFSEVLARVGWSDAIARAELKFDLVNFLGLVLRWVLVLVFLKVAADIAGFVSVGAFLGNVVGYLPNLVAAVFMLVITVVVADILERAVRAALRHAEVKYVNLMGSVVRWGVWVFGILAVLNQLQIASTFLQTLFTGIVAVFVIAFGLAFGLGGKDVAARILEDLRRNISGE